MAAVSNDDNAFGNDVTAVPRAPPGQKKNKRKNKKKTGNKSLFEQHQAETDRSKEKYKRGTRLRVKGVTDKKLKARLKAQEDAARSAVVSAARAEILLPESSGYLEAEDATEKTYKFSQKEIVKHVDTNTAAKVFQLSLPDHAPYKVDYSKNGRYMLLGGRKGHLSLLDALRNTPLCEVYVNETIKDVEVLHNHTMFAVAQKKHIYIYDDTGCEIHRLKSHISPSCIEFLPYHFLLASVGEGGWLKYQDTSTGELVSEHRTKLGACDTMCQNPWNSIISLGHSNGTVTLWSPSSSQPLVKMLCHKGPVTSIAVDGQGINMVTAGLDGKVSVWDARMYRKVHSYFAHRTPQSVQISQTGLLAVDSGYQVHIWKDALRKKAQSPYMRHEMPGEEITSLKFRPYEDVLGIGLTSGIATIVVPGAGEANFDSFEANPFENRKQRQETEVHGLLEKLKPDMIVLDPDSLAKVDTTLRQEDLSARLDKSLPKIDLEKNRARGKNKYGKRIKRKHRNIIDKGRMQVRMKNEIAKKRKSEANAKGAENNVGDGEALSRFAKGNKR